MPSDTFAAGIEAALATVPPGWSWSIGQMMGLPEERRYRCFLSDHNSADKIARVHCDHDDATPVVAILGAVEKVYRLWPDTPRALTPTASEATAIEAGEDISDAHRFLSLSSGFGHIPAADGKRMAGFFYSNDAAEAAGAMPAHAMSAIKRIVAAFATASPKIASDTAPGVRDRIGVENYFRCGFRAARYFFDPTIARGKSTPEEEDYTKWFMADYDALLASRPALAASPTASDTDTAIPGGGDEFATIEAWEHDDQRELSLLYNHRADDTPQFNRGQMRSAIRHGRSLSANSPGWVVGNGSGTLWRWWPDGMSAWTADIEKATRYARREDAEAVHREDEDAWTVKPYPATSPKPDTDTPVDPGVEGGETLDQYGDRIAARVRKQMMERLDDDVIAKLGESHVIFGKACAIEAVANAMREMQGFIDIEKCAAKPIAGMDAGES